MDVISSMAHLRSDSIELLMMDSSVQIWGFSFVLQVPWESVNPGKKGLISWVDHMKLHYDMILLL
jgi:hypothetical protein